MMVRTGMAALPPGGWGQAGQPGPHPTVKDAGCEADGPEQGMSQAAGLGEDGGLVEPPHRDAVAGEAVVEGRHGIDAGAELAAERVQMHAGRARFQAAVAAGFDPDRAVQAADPLVVDPGLQSTTRR